MVENAWHQTQVFVTGHTGFKGAWLSLALQELGASLHGYALNPPTNPNLFDALGIGELFKSDTRADLSDLVALRNAIEIAQPEVIFHLAAQPLVRAGYSDPIGTFATNVMGTAHLLEAIRGLDCVKAIVIITTDKVYENREWIYPYRESDPLGGYDPYSASKAAAEILVSSYRSSFFNPVSACAPNIASVRAGNVIGGGDWAKDRLLPDCLRAFQAGQSVRLRYPNAVRPWQHVLEPVLGYILIANKLRGKEADRYACAWNFGPDASGDATVGDVAQWTAEAWGKGACVEIDPVKEHPHEAGLLRLDISRVRSELGWRPGWSVREAIDATVDWHKAWLEHQDMRSYSLGQIQAYRSAQAV
jgi:CDP-glucose 4,6-dehydratase